MIALPNMFRRLIASPGIRYHIGGRAYVQRPLVLLQMEQLVEYINPAMFAGLQVANAAGVVKLLGDKVAAILAIVLIPEGVEVDQKDLPAIADHLRANVDIETAAKVVEGFLSCNRVASVLDRLTGLLQAGAQAKQAVTGSLSSSASSPAAT